MSADARATISVALKGAAKLDAVLMWAALCEEALGMPPALTIVSTSFGQIEATAYLDVLAPAAAE